MHGTVFILVLVLYCVHCDDLRLFGETRVNNEVVVVDSPDGGAIPPTVYRTVNKYECSVDDNFPGSHLVVYGEKEWKFPRQTVNLTLIYPTEQEITSRFDSSEEEDFLLITGFKVIIYIDGETSQGFITDGGILQDTIRLSFISADVTSLKYQFWLHGVSANRPELIGFSSTMNPINMCR